MIMIIWILICMTRETILSSNTRTITDDACKNANIAIQALTFSAKCLDKAIDDHEDDDDMAPLTEKQRQNVLNQIREKETNLDNLLSTMDCTPFSNIEVRTQLATILTRDIKYILKMFCRFFSNEEDNHEVECVQNNEIQKSELGKKLDDVLRKQIKDFKLSLTCIKQVFSNDEFGEM
ncbi:hypothetical protein THOM_0663 [Trachipleistophora hominis]|uniref:Uncharacterized protein n=1 Tax=Trachipleistophora hominis TaxID=72359 RepID=L7JZ78_TRAHO|nr:hypothetical protein THOM_0663 [Trachipleistophora hominis]